MGRRHFSGSGRFIALGAGGLILVLAASAAGATIIGTPRADVLRGTAAADVLRGKGGNDRLIGLAGNDRFYGDAGRDTIVCGPGRDIVYADAADKFGTDCEVVRRIGGGSPTPPPPPPPPPRPPPPPPPPAGTRENPFPVGTESALGDGWRLTVVSSIPDATAMVLAENQFNDPPKPGFQFFIARVQATFAGPGSARFGGTFRLRSVGAAGVSYSAFENSCGVIPDPISDTEVFSGGTITGNVCWEIRNSDAGSLVLYDDPVRSVPTRLFFALH